MQSILQDRAIGKLSSVEFGFTVTETLYTNLQQASGRHVFPPNCHGLAAVNSLAVEQNDYRFMLSGCADSSIKLWDLKHEDAFKAGEVDEDQEWENHKYDVPDTVFSEVAVIPRRSVHLYGVSCIQWWPFDTGMFVSGSFDHTVKVWDTNQLTPVHEFDLESRVYSFDICGSVRNSMDVSALVAVACDLPFVRLLDLRSSSNAHMLRGHKNKTLCAKWHPSYPHIIATGGFDGEVKIWDIRRSKSCLCRLDMLRTNSSESKKFADNLTRTSVKAHLGPVNGLVWDTKGYTLFTTGNDDKIRVWDMISSLAPPINKLINFGPLTRNKYLQTVPLVLSPTHELELQYLFFPSDNGDVYVFRTIDAKLVIRLKRKGTKNSGRTSSVACAGPFTGTYFCGTMDGEIISWIPQYQIPPVEKVADFDSQHTSSGFDPSSRDLMKETELELERSRLYDDPFFRSNLGSS